MRSNMERVLRAMDVIPPFGDDSGNGSPAGEPVSGLAARPRIQPWTRPQPRMAAPTESDASSGSEETAKHIPTLDLGEKILAEQRRMTARKRRAPGSSHIDSGAVQPPSVAAPRPPRAVEPSAQDALQLEQLVAEIVARDIDRLCSGPARTFV
ncbi:MAG TPA: hypothetical protein PLU87_16705 [Sedimentisphaerales bacterium]|nr:hypothetical protein [Sedimentisphaerales bacterium]